MSVKPVQLGFVAPLSNEQSIVAVPMLQAARLAIKEFQLEGKDFLPELLPLDDQAQGKIAAIRARELVANPQVLAVIGHKNSQSTAAAGQIYHQAGLLLVTPSATGSTLTKEGWNNFYRLCADDERQGEVGAHFAFFHLQEQTAVVVHDETLYGESLAGCFHKPFMEAGGEVLKTVKVQQGEKEFTTVLKVLAEEKPGLLYMALTEIESSMLARAVRGAGLTTILMGADGSKGSQFPSLAGEFGEGAYMSYAGFWPEGSEAGEVFLQKYKGLYGECPVYGAETYDATQMILQAISRCQSKTREEVLKACKKEPEWRGITGPLQFTPKGERKKASVSIWKVVTGEMKLIKTYQ